VKDEESKKKNGENGKQKPNTKGNIFIFPQLVAASKELNNPITKVILKFILC
jgi:hypothetical protein